MRALVTQNIDGLHQRAGFPPERLIEIHGNVTHGRCLDCRAPMSLDDVRRQIEATGASPRCACGGLVKAAIISFGERDAGRGDAPGDGARRERRSLPRARLVAAGAAGGVAAARRQALRRAARDRQPRRNATRRRGAMSLFAKRSGGVCGATIHSLLIRCQANTKLRQNCVRRARSTVLTFVSNRDGCTLMRRTAVREDAGSYGVAQMGAKPTADATPERRAAGRGACRSGRDFRRHQVVRRCEGLRVHRARQRHARRAAARHLPAPRRLPDRL